MKKKTVPKPVVYQPDETESASVQEVPDAVMEVGAFDAKTHLSALLGRVAKGETFLITKHGKPVAELKPAGAQPKSRMLGWGKGAGFWMADDFDAPLDDFKEYQE